MEKRTLIGAIILAVLAVSGFAQPAPPATATVNIGGSTITVKYSALSVKGRKIFGGVVPYGKAWGIGENAVATLSTDSDLVFKGGGLPAGDYSLYILPAADGWQLIFSKATGAQALNYDAKMDVGRVPMAVSTAKAPVETCKITLGSVAGVYTKLELAWENTVASVSLYRDVGASDPEW